jgi:hypothetical protein
MPFCPGRDGALQFRDAAAHVELDSDGDVAVRVSLLLGRAPFGKIFLDNALNFAFDFGGEHFIKVRPSSLVTFQRGHRTALDQFLRRLALESYRPAHADKFHFSTPHLLADGRWLPAHRRREFFDVQ